MSVTARSIVTAALLSTSTLLFALAASAQTSSSSAPQPPKLTLAFEMHVQVAQPVDLGEVTHGRRRIVEILGGTFEGPEIKGRVVPGGADWQMIQPDGFSELDTRYSLETDQGEIIYVQNFGIRHAPPEVMRKLNAGESVDPSLVYFRTMPRFETSSPRLQWLVRSVFIGTGERYPDGVRIWFWRVE
ncbi:MAG: DUF3237 domain-containing protein [Gammaproteobacteria bacterium]|nr:DUF3237 domain-containing protein [Gammaproteobacteria bacterium]